MLYPSEGGIVQIYPQKPLARPPLRKILHPPDPARARRICPESVRVKFAGFSFAIPNVVPVAAHAIKAVCPKRLNADPPPHPVGVHRTRTVQRRVALAILNGGGIKLLQPQTLLAMIPASLFRCEFFHIAPVIKSPSAQSMQCARPRSGSGCIPTQRDHTRRSRHNR